MEDNKNIKQLSNPFSTGGGGVSFEHRVQSVFVLSMLTDMTIPIYRNCNLVKMRFQARHAGYSLDDMVLYAENRDGSEAHKLLCQIKHKIHMTSSDVAFGECLDAAWQDFQNESLFEYEKDALVFITASLTQTDSLDGVILLSWARASDSCADFIARVYSERFSSKEKQKKFEIIRDRINNANASPVSDDILWRFMRSLYFLQYDLEDLSSPLFTCLNHIANEHLGDIVLYVQECNLHAAVVTKSGLPSALSKKYSAFRASEEDCALTNIDEHNRLIMSNIRSQIGDTHVSRLDIEQNIESALQDHSFLFVTGERGSGKSAVVKDYCEGKEKAFILYLRAEELDAPHFRKTLEDMGVHTSLKTMGQMFALYSERILVIESVEKMLESHNTAAFFDLLNLLEDTGFKVICTIREYGLKTILYTYFGDTKLSFYTLRVPLFSEQDLALLKEQLPQLKYAFENPNLHSIISNPFYLQSLYKAQYLGYSINKDATITQVRELLWNAIIKNSQDRSNGLPFKRESVFMDIAVTRAKNFRYAIPYASYDLEVIMKLEEEGLISLANGLVAIKHDVMEDWGICQFIDQAHAANQTDLPQFFMQIGNEPAMNRGFRIWLSEKLEQDDKVISFIESILDSGIESRWISETIAAIVQCELFPEYLKHLQHRLLENNNALLLHMCFIVRISQKEVSMLPIPAFSKPSRITSTLRTKPTGACWDTIISFLLKNYSHLDKKQYIHYIRFVSEWSKTISISAELPESSIEAGQLATMLLKAVYEQYDLRKEVGNICDVMIKVYPQIKEECCELLESRLTADTIHTPGYALATQMVTDSVGASFMAHYDPEMLIKITKEYLYIKSAPKRNDFGFSSPIDSEHSYGLRHLPQEYQSSNGLHQPFQALFQFVPTKGIKLCIELCNDATNAFIDSCISEGTTIQDVESMMCSIELNNGKNIRQFASGNFWCAYRGFGNIPYILQCVLMAMENALIDLISFTVDHPDEPGMLKQLQDIINYILERSNSVMPTAVVASIAAGFHQQLGDAIFPILRTPLLYTLDIDRKAHEHTGMYLNWSSFESMSTMYNQERKESNDRSWRKQGLDEVALKMQFSEYKEEMFSIIDKIDDMHGNDIDWRFTKERIDLRNFKVEYHKKEKQYTFDEELEEIRSNKRKNSASFHRFIAISNWANKEWEREDPVEIYDPVEKFEEIKELITNKPADSSETATLYRGALTKGIALLIRDCYQKLSRKQRVWCIHYILSIIESEGELFRLYSYDDRVNQNGTDVCAYILPFLLTCDGAEKQKKRIKNAIILTYTHPCLTVLNAIANGVADFLHDGFSYDADSILQGYFQYALAKNIYLSEIQKEQLRPGNESNKRYGHWLKSFRKTLLKSKVFAIDITQADMSQLSPFDVNVLLHMLHPCIEDKCHIFIEKLVAQWFQFESLVRRSHPKNNRNEHVTNEYFGTCICFPKAFARYLWNLGEYMPYIEVIRKACTHGPSFLQSFMLDLALKGEKIDDVSFYWAIWEAISSSMIVLCRSAKSNTFEYDSDYRDLIHTLMHYGAPFSEIDYEKQYIKTGKDHILAFAHNAAQNREVFEGMAHLIYHFPNLFLPEALYALAKVAKGEMVCIFTQTTNTLFYLERAIHTVITENTSLYMDETLYHSCLLLLDAMVDSASAIAYYTREYLLRSKKIGVVTNGVAIEDCHSSH